jgi:hypothetical protein
MTTSGYWPMHCILATLFIAADTTLKPPLSAFNGKMLLHSKWLNWLQLRAAIHKGNIRWFSQQLQTQIADQLIQIFHQSIINSSELNSRYE